LGLPLLYHHRLRFLGLFGGILPLLLLLFDIICCDSDAT